MFGGEGMFVQILAEELLRAQALNGDAAPTASTSEQPSFSATQAARPAVSAPIAFTLASAVPVATVRPRRASPPSAARAASAPRAQSVPRPLVSSARTILDPPYDGALSSSSESDDDRTKRTSRPPASIAPGRRESFLRLPTASRAPTSEPDVSEGGQSTVGPVSSEPSSELSSDETSSEGEDEAELVIDVECVREQAAGRGATLPPALARPSPVSARLAPQSVPDRAGETGSARLGFDSSEDEDDDARSNGSATPRRPPALSRKRPQVPTPSSTAPGLSQRVEDQAERSGLADSVRSSVPLPSSAAEGSVDEGVVHKGVTEKVPRKGRTAVVGAWTPKRRRGRKVTPQPESRPIGH